MGIGVEDFSYFFRIVFVKVPFEMKATFSREKN